MPTSPELKLLLRPLFKRHPELAFARRVLFFAPLTHYLRGVVFGSKMSGASDVIPFACPLYTGDSLVDVEATENQDEFRIWPEWKSDPFGTSWELCDILERRFLPSVEPIVDFESHLNAPEYIPVDNPDRWNSPSMNFWRALSACTVGSYDSAQELLERSEDVCTECFPGRVTEEFRFAFSTFERIRYLLNLLRTDRAQVLVLLHDWEAFTVRENKMLKYWKSTPFRCEL